MNFRINRMDKAVIPDLNRLKTLKGLIRDYEYMDGKGWAYNKHLSLFFQDRHNLSETFPEERLDKKIVKLPYARLVNYAVRMEYEDGGELPDDLTVTESILTDVLWGKRDKSIAALLVAALENMDLEDVHHELENLGFD
ncbi:MAG: hypothetical protein IPM26_04855 [Saprospiraceae bacterium]|nr:hypothetical protein [Saprospiraceae bacterium]